MSARICENNLNSIRFEPSLLSFFIVRFSGGWIMSLLGRLAAWKFVILLDVVAAGLVGVHFLLSGGEPPTPPPPDPPRNWFVDVTEKSGIKTTYRSGEETGHFGIIES